MRAIAVNFNSGVGILFRISIASDMRAFLHNGDPQTPSVGTLLRNSKPEKARSHYYQIVIH